MQANDLLKYRDKIIQAFRDGTFLSEHLKKTDDAAYNYVLKDVNSFIQEIKSMEEKNNLSLFEDFLDYHHQLIMQKCLFILKIQMETKKNLAEIEDRISNLKDRIKEMSETGKNL